MVQIKINFLPVGHTHEDIDQFFSRISPKVREIGAETLEGKIYIELCSTYLFNSTLHTHSEMQARIAESFSPTPKVEQLKEWLTGHINEIHGHTMPLHFKLQADESGKAILYTKKWTTSEWHSHGSLLKVYVAFKNVKNSYRNAGISLAVYIL